jgi:PqqD family protein of HPr-rel-A system
VVDNLFQPRCWKIAKVIFKHWSDGVVVFNVDSGNTHLLNPVTARILKTFAEQPADVVQLARHLASQDDIDADDELIAELEKVLIQLDEMGLIESASQ